MMTTSQFPDLIDLRVTKIHDDEYEQLYTMDNPVDILYGVETISNAYDIESQVGGLGDIPEFTGNIGYDDAAQGYDTQFNVKEFSGGIKAQRLLLKTDRLKVIEGKAQALGEAGMRSICKDAMSVFINASTQAMPGPGGAGDGLSLGNNAHTSAYPGAAYTFDNLHTTAFSVVQLETLRQAGLRIRNDRNEITPILYDTIICPPELEGAVNEVVGSPGKPGSGNNDINFQAGKWKVYSSPWLTSSTDWFVASSKHMRKWLLWKWLERPDFSRDSEFDTHARKWAVYYSYAKGWVDWRFVQVSDVA